MEDAGAGATAAGRLDWLEALSSSNLTGLGLFLLGATTAGPLEELEFGGGAKAGEDWIAAAAAVAAAADGDSELGEDTRDFASLHVPFSALLVSGLVGTCLVIPKSTSATSNSISWTAEGGLEFLGGRSLLPLPPLSGFIFFLTDAVEDDGEMGVVEAAAGAGGLGLAGEVEACR